MKAAVARQPHSPLSILEVELRTPESTEVVVRLEATGICHSDLKTLEGRSRAPGWPLISGHEGVGRVERIGDQVSLVAEGDRVLFSFVSSCGRCFWCLRGQENLCSSFRATATPKGRLRDGEDVYGHADLGAFAERALVGERALVPVSSALDSSQLCLISCGVTTGVCGALHAGDIVAGDVVAVVGLGGVGLSAVQGARLAGARAIIGVDPVPARRANAIALGATEVAPVSEAATEWLHATTDARGADVAIDAVGAQDTAGDAYAMTRRGGTIVLLGADAVPPPWTLHQQMTESKTVRGALYGGAHPRRDFHRLIELAEAGRIDLADMVTQQISLTEINDGIASMAQGAGRVVVTF